MTHKVVYRHICGYPLEEGSELTHCPGCGGRVTPWNVKIATPFPVEGDADETVRYLMHWLVSDHPDLADSLERVLQTELVAGEDGAGTRLTREQMDVLRRAHSALLRARSES